MHPKNHQNDDGDQSDAELAELKARAEARLVRREEQKRDAPIAMHEYRTAEQAQRDQTAKLREERKIREARSANNVSPAKSDRP
jgi:hypothetical protein